MPADPRDVYVSDLIRFIAATAADLPLDKRRALMRAFLPCEWDREGGRVRLTNAYRDDLGQCDSNGPLVPGFPTIEGRGLTGERGQFYQSHRLVGDVDIADGLDCPWIGPGKLHAYLLRLRDAGVLL